MGQRIGRRLCREWTPAVVGCVLAVGIVTVLAVGIVTPAAAQDDTGFSVTYDPLQGPPGTTITITGRCVYQGQPAEYVKTDLIEGDRLVSRVDIPINADGTFNGSVLVPPEERPGPHRLGSSCFLDDFAIDGYKEDPFQVTAPPTTPPPTTAPATTAPPTSVATTTTITTAATTTEPPTTVPATTVPPTTAPTTTVDSAAPVSSDGAGTTLPALAAAGAVAGAAALTVRHRRRRTPQ